MQTNDNGVNRDMTEAEKSYYQLWLKDVELTDKAQAKAKADKATAKQAVLAKLGLTADEVAALLS